VPVVLAAGIRSATLPAGRSSESTPISLRGEPVGVRMPGGRAVRSLVHNPDQVTKLLGVVCANRV